MRARTVLSSVPMAIGMIVVTHFWVDAYANSIPALLGLLEVRCGLSEAQSAWFTGFGALASGLSQPLFAWLSDRLDTRIFASLGVTLATLCFCFLGLADTPPSLFLVYGGGMLGLAMYHPIAASAIGQILPSHRGSLVSLFFVSGMAGSAGGALVAPYFTRSEAGFHSFQYLIAPALILAILLQMAIGGTSHRQPWHESPHSAASSSLASRWLPLLLLYCASVLRASVNLVLFYLFLRWLTHAGVAQHPTWSAKQISDAVAPTLGLLVAVTQVGMAVGGIVAGFWIAPFRERRALVIVPIVFAPSILLVPFVPLPGTYVLALLSGVGIAATIPVSISVAQRWLPRHPSVASGLMLGGAWTLSMLSVPLAQWCLDRVSLAAVFAGTAVALALSGLLMAIVSDGIFRVESLPRTERATSQPSS